MSEYSLYIPSPNPDKRLGTTHLVSSANHSLFLNWMIPTSFITVDPEISLCWVSLNKNPVNVDWVFKYQYLNKESCIGYFDETGMPIVSFDDGRSKLHSVTLNSEGDAEPDIIQTTRPLPLVKNDRRSGTFVAMEIQAHPQLGEVYLMGAHIKYTEAPRVIEPTGRKRTRKRKWYDEEPYPYG